MVTDWEYLATTQANCTDNYSTLDLLSQGWSGEVRQGASGEKGMGRAVSLRNNPWNNSQYKGSAGDPSQGSPYRVLWRKERITAKADRKQ